LKEGGGLHGERREEVLKEWVVKYVDMDMLDISRAELLSIRRERGRQFPDLEGVVFAPLFSSQPFGRGKGKYIQ
jgi:hypothetical protein